MDSTDAHGGCHCHTLLHGRCRSLFYRYVQPRTLGLLPRDIADADHQKGGQEQFIGRTREGTCSVGNWGLAENPVASAASGILCSSRIVQVRPDFRGIIAISLCYTQANLKIGVPTFPGKDQKSPVNVSVHLLLGQI